MHRTGNSAPEQPGMPTRPDVIDASRETDTTNPEHPSDPSPPDSEIGRRESSHPILQATPVQLAETDPEPSSLNPETDPTRATDMTPVGTEETDNPDNGTGAEGGGGEPSSAETNSAWHSVDLSAESSTDRARRIEEETRCAGAWWWERSFDEPF